MRPQVSIVIPTWNRCDLVMACLESVAQLESVRYEVIVSDDGSTDTTAERVTAAYPEVRVVRRAKNGGFAVAVNAGVAVAQGEWIFLLNNDVTLEPDCLARMLEVAQLSAADMVAPLLLWRDEPTVVYSAGDRIGVNGRPESIGFRTQLKEFTLPTRIFGVSAAAGLYRRVLWDTVGGLDENFTAYFEDSDLCFRARLAGFTAALAPQACAYHIGSASIAGKTWWRSVQCYRNHALLVYKNMPAPLLWRYAAPLFREHLHQVYCAFSAARTEFGALGALRILARTCFSLGCKLPAALRARRRIQSQRKIDLDALQRALEERSE